MRKVLWMALFLMGVMACQSEQANEENNPSSEGETITFWVFPFQTQCIGVGPQTCYEVGYGEERPENWELFYDSIEGFEFKEGVMYKLKVMKTPVENPPADASSFRYKLVKVVKEWDGIIDPKANRAFEAARLKGVHLRAVGNEPFWNLEVVKDKHLRFDKLGEEAMVSVPYAEPVKEENTETYTIETEKTKLTAVIEHTPCEDNMSGETFELSVTLTINGETYKGCGSILNK
ncbi:DUF4377 domain-containing protein [Rapidithrix thailandica]|uniref:DUF4377 domain-containing protein n=1 Tax=Rapidithrix thailandica TaxID=413964 RepID=A0AAW9RVT7_9BACT